MSDKHIVVQTDLFDFSQHDKVTVEGRIDGWTNPANYKDAEMQRKWERRLKISLKGI